MANDNTKRFSNRAEDYVKYRPHYPAAIVAYLENKYAIPPGAVVADIGAGTGISTAMFLDAGYAVWAVEPNKQMREMAISLLGDRPRFHYTGGTAEHTGLAPESADLAVAGQAFHWFDAGPAAKELTRILKEQGVVALFWNERQVISAFEKEYEMLIQKHGRNYKEVRHRNIDLQAIQRFFGAAPVSLECFHKEQSFDFEGLKGRLSSSSYMPAAGEEGYDDMIAELKQLFDRYAEAGRIVIHYETRLYSGRWLKEATSGLPDKS